MQLPFVLQSAETMKAAVAHLEPFLEKAAGHGKGRIVLATVKGDVHDIGKNLVDIILSNNGYTVFNLGIKQPISAILHACQEHHADAIGMSGLLVKSVAVMKENLEEMNAQQVKVPVLLGGAALTRSYAEGDLAKGYRGPLFYCKDAFEGLHTMDRIMAGQAAQVQAEQQAYVERRQALREKAMSERPEGHELPERSEVARDNPVPVPPFWGRREVRDIPVEQVFPFINELALFRGQWGFKKAQLTDEQFERLTDEKARPVFQALQQRATEQRLLEPKVVYGYFPAQADGDDVVVYHVEEFEEAVQGSGFRAQDGIPGPPLAHPWMRFRFPRQSSRRRLCLADFFRDKASGQYDVLGVQLVTVGSRASQAGAGAVRGQQVPGLPVSARLWRRERRGVGGVVAQADAPRVGVRLRGCPAHPRPVPAALPRQPLQLRLWRLPQPGGPREDHRAAPAGIPRGQP